MIMYREKNDIIILILDGAKTPQTLSALSKKINLNLIHSKRYVDALSEAKYLDEVQVSGKLQYQVNMEGIDFLRDLKDSAKGLERFNKYW